MHLGDLLYVLDDCLCDLLLVVKVMCKDLSCCLPCHPNLLTLSISVLYTPNYKYSDVTTRGSTTLTSVMVTLIHHEVEYKSVGHDCLALVLFKLTPSFEVDRVRRT